MHPSRRSPRTPLCRQRVRFVGFALARLRREQRQQTRQSERWLRGSVGMKECFPDRTQEQLYSKPPLFAVSRWRVTLGKRVPAVSRETLRADGPVH